MLRLEAYPLIPHPVDSKRATAAFSSAVDV
jgi:hypothetical protein